MAAVVRACQIGHFLLHHALRLRTHHHGRSGLSNRDGVAVDRVARHVVVAASRTGQLAVLAEDRGDLGTVEHAHNCLLAVVVAQRLPGGANQRCAYQWLEGQDDVAVGVQDVELISDQHVGCGRAEIGEEGLLLRHGRLRARHHGRGAQLDGQGLAVDGVGAAVVVAAGVSAHSPTVKDSGRLNIRQGHRQLTGGIGISNQLPGRTLKGCGRRDRGLVDHLDQRPCKAGRVGRHVGPGFFQNLELVFEAWLILETLDFIVEERPLRFRALLDLVAGLGRHTRARDAVRPNKQGDNLTFGG